MKMSYTRFLAMIATSTLAMFALMYLNTYAWDHVRFSETRAYAALYMGATMAIIMLAFMLGNILVGIAGAAYGHVLGFIAPNNFTFGDSLILVSIILLGGIGNLWGVAVAAAVVVILPEKFQVIQEYRFALYAALVIMILLFRPQGLLPRRLRAYVPGGDAARAP